MKTRKLNFAEMGKTLTRAEMKQIMAGSGTYGCNKGWYCADNLGCQHSTVQYTDCKDNGDGTCTSANCF